MRQCFQFLTFRQSPLLNLPKITAREQDRTATGKIDMLNGTELLNHREMVGQDEFAFGQPIDVDPIPQVLDSENLCFVGPSNITTEASYFRILTGNLEPYMRVISWQDHSTAPVSIL